MVQCFLCRRNIESGALQRSTTTNKLQHLHLEVSACFSTSYLVFLYLNIAHNGLETEYAQIYHCSYRSCNFPQVSNSQWPENQIN